MIQNTPLNPSIGCYLRVSSDSQSTDMQRRELDEYAKARGWKAVRYYEDKAMTGTNANRPMLQQLLSDVHRRKIEIVLIWKLDRLFRSLRDLVNTLQLFSELGVSLISFKENIDMSSSSGRLLVHLLGAFSEFEASLIRERVRAGLRNAKAKGKRLGRPKKRDDEKIIALRKRGLSIRQISKELCISIGAIQRCLAVSKTTFKEWRNFQ